MKSLTLKLWSAITMLALALPPGTGRAEDIDIFIGESAGDAGNPNVLIVLDNTSNWARQSQQWPNGLQQGQSEARSIMTVLSALGNDINVGVLEFVTQGTANDNGGFVRYAVREMTATNKSALSAQMDMIFNDINGPLEKRNSNTEYGYLWYDIYNYWAGGNAYNPNAADPVRADEDGYTTTYSTFKSPLSLDTVCARNYVIFISNPNASGPANDSNANNTVLAGLGGDTNTIALPEFTVTTTNTSSNLGNTQACYSDSTDCTTKMNGATTTEFATCTNGTYTSCSCGTTPVASEGSCPAGTLRYSVIGTDAQGSKRLGYDSNCVSNVNQCSTTGYAAHCSGTGVSCACSASDYITTSCTSNKKRYAVVRTKSNTTTTNFGYTANCYANQAACTTTDYAAQCTTLAGYATGSGCACGSPTTASNNCPDGKNNYAVTGISEVTQATPTGTYNATKGAPWHSDEWSRFLFQKGVPVSGSENQTITTYTIDVFNAQQNADHTALMMSTAKAGGGKYFAATNEQALVNALRQIFSEIMSVNSTFASASLPVNATNRTQNENQVFIGMFRPDPKLYPRWFGNLKRYQIIQLADGVTYDLGDKTGTHAVNLNTGFVSDCATSWWTTDSPLDPNDLSKGYYWTNIPVEPSPASKCSSVTGAQVYSDSPDGPTVEKGAVAEVIRKGNNPTTTNAAPTWAVSRAVLTTASATSKDLVSIDSAPALDATQKNWVKGQDTSNEDSDTNLTETRASIHGDVVHSRPIPVNYGSQIVVYYGANDGFLRAVDAETGKELWALMPYEFAQPSFVDRLRNNSPLVFYPGVDTSIVPTPQKKAYAWDGSIGIAQDLSSNVWIYPTMRRGGQMVYAMDVSTPTSPTIKWKAGCYSGSCTSGFSDMGQSWSTPRAGRVKGYPDEKVVFFGGGYDTCEDANSLTPPCSSPRGDHVYAVNASSGSLLQTFDTDRSVAADVALIDVDGDSKVDYVYVADTGGNLYRIDMVTPVTATDASGKTVVTSYAEKAAASWTIRKVAYAAEGRKFLFAPALLAFASEGKVYVAIGSGDREHPLRGDYPYSSVLNRFYVYVDDLTVASGAAYDLNTLVNRTTDPGCDPAANILPTSTAKGWYMDLNQYGQGEQTVTSPLIIGGEVAFSTNRPVPPEAGACYSFLGEARGYWVNLLNSSGTIGVEGKCGGARSDAFVGGGMPPSPVMGVVPVGNQTKTIVIGAAQRGGGASTPIGGQSKDFSIPSIRKRTYWRTTGAN